MSATRSSRSLRQALNGTRACSLRMKTTPIALPRRILAASPSQLSPSPRPLGASSQCRYFSQSTTFRERKGNDATATGRSPLHDLHTAYGAKFVEFGGYDMPVQYSDLSLGESHKWTREKASLFDVSHMVQNEIEGKDVIDFLQSITPSSLKDLPFGQSTLSCLLTPEGGIVDDTVITRLGENKFYFVTNAGCRQKDAKYLGEQLTAWKQKHSSEIQWTILHGKGLIALQGPMAADVLESVVAEPEKAGLKEFYFGQSRHVQIKFSDRTVPVLVARGGYTGEDGFEISIPEEETVAVTEALLNSAGKDKLRLAGLGARDSLRLEAGMCLYGHDISEDTTPPEGGLTWVVAKDRRSETDPEKGAFLGANKINAQIAGKKNGGIAIERRRIGLVVEGSPAREGAELYDSEGNLVGNVTSGCPSPSLGKNIAMGYVKSGSHKQGTELQVKVRNKMRKATVTKMPFVPSKYHKPSGPI